MRPFASLSLDLDNQWSYMKTHGDDAWREYPSYFDVAVPRILEFLAQRRLTITFFIVGQDAALEKNRPWIAEIARAGHEIGSHSFLHEPWLHLYSEQELEQELVRAEQALVAATGHRPVGFRGPGFSLSGTTLRVLARRGYEYDCTVFPNALNPLARAYFFATSRLSKEEKQQRKALFGTFADAFRPVKPFRWNLGAQELLEIPVTTMPLAKIPVHLSYVLYLSKYSRLAARGYWRAALGMFRLTRTAPSILLHPLDFLGREDCPALSFFPGMDLPLAHKLAIVDDVVGTLASRYEIVTMREHARRLREAPPRRVLTPEPARA